MRYGKLGGQKKNGNSGFCKESPHGGKLRVKKRPGVTVLANENEKGESGCGKEQTWDNIGTVFGSWGGR